MSKERRPDDHPERGDSTAADAVGESADESSEDTASESAGGGDTFTSSRRSVLTGLGAAGLGLGSGQLGVVGTASAADSHPPAIENLYVASNVGIHSYTTSDSHGDSPKSFYRPYTASYGGFGDSWGGLTGFIPPGDSVPSVYGVADENSKAEKVVAVPTNNGDFATTPTDHRTLKMVTQEESASVNEGIDIFTANGNLFAAAEVDTNTSGVFRWFPGDGGDPFELDPHFVEVDFSSLSGYDFSGVPSASHYDQRTTTIYTAYQTTFDRQIVKYEPPPFGNTVALGADDGAITYPDPDGLLQSLEIRDFARCQFSNDPETDSTLYALVGGQTDQGYFAGIIERTGENTWSPVRLPDVFLPGDASIVPGSGPRNAIMKAGIPKQMVAADNVLFFRTVNFGDDWVVGVDPRYAGGPDQRGHISVKTGVGRIGTLFVDPSTDGVYDAASDCITRRTPSDRSTIFGTENEYCDLFADAARTSAVTSVSPCLLDSQIDKKRGKISLIRNTAVQSLRFPQAIDNRVEEGPEEFVNDVDDGTITAPDERLCEAMQRLNAAEDLTLETTQSVTGPDGDTDGDQLGTGDNLLRTTIENVKGALWGKFCATFGGGLGRATGATLRAVAWMARRLLRQVPNITRGLGLGGLLRGSSPPDWLKTVGRWSQRQLRNAWDGIKSHMRTGARRTRVGMKSFARDHPDRISDLYGSIGSSEFNFLSDGLDALGDVFNDPAPLDLIEELVFMSMYFSETSFIPSIPDADEIEAMLSEPVEFESIPEELADVNPVSLSLPPEVVPDLDQLQPAIDLINEFVEKTKGLDPSLDDQVEYLRNNVDGLDEQSDTTRKRVTQDLVNHVSGTVDFVKRTQWIFDEIGSLASTFNHIAGIVNGALLIGSVALLAITGGFAAPVSLVLVNVAGVVGIVTSWVTFVSMIVDLLQALFGLMSILSIAIVHNAGVEALVRSTPSQLEGI